MVVRASVSIVGTVVVNVDRFVDVRSRLLQAPTILGVGTLENSQNAVLRSFLTRSSLMFFVSPSRMSCWAGGSAWFKQRTSLVLVLSKGDK